MSSLNKIKKFADKIPKKKIIKKAGIYVVKKLIGGPYLDVAGVLVKSTKDKAMSYAGNYAYERFIRSTYTKKRVNAIPMIVVATVIRMIFSFLIISKLQSGIIWLDFIISVTVTVIVTILAPFFYISIEAHKDIFMKYTDIFINNFLGPNGYEYVEMVKNVILFIIATFILILLQFVQITSRYIQKIIIHLMITGAISDLIQRWIDTMGGKRRLYYGMTYFPPTKAYSLADKNYVSIPHRLIQYCDTKNRVIMGSKKQRASIVSRDKLKNYIMVDLGHEFEEMVEEKKIHLISIINDYEQ